MQDVDVFFIVWLTLGVFIFITLYIRGRKAMSIFPDIDSVQVNYRDKTASGYSTKSRITKMGGANKVLDVVVTDKELWLKSMLLFASIGDQYDLLHKIALSDISGINRQGKKITVDFRTENTESKQVVIITKKPDDFLNALKKYKN